MIKGDKVLCIKDCHHKDEKPYLEGVWYEILGNLDDNTVIILNYEIKKPKESSSQFNFFTTDGKIYFKLFQEHFITLAEWREKQINSILDEE